MAIDNTPPRLRLIVTIAIIVVITLVGLDFVFKSYYAYMTDQAQLEKLAPTKDREQQTAAEKAALAAGKMPIEQAMAQLKGARGELVEPKPSEDMGPMTGWSKMPKHAPLPAPGDPGTGAPAHAGTPGLPDPHAAGDGGVDAGVGGGNADPAANPNPGGDAGTARSAPHGADAGAAVTPPRRENGGTPVKDAKDAGATAPQH